MTLDQCKLYAQRQANSQGVALMILNLNRFNPLYVVRHYRAGDEKRADYVEHFKPEAPKEDFSAGGWFDL